METRSLGRSGIDVSVVGLGGNAFNRFIDRDEVGAVVDAALGAGITLFDTADYHGHQGGSERLLGEALRGEVTEEQLDRVEALAAERRRAARRRADLSLTAPGRRPPTTSPARPAR